MRRSLAYSIADSYLSMPLQLISTMVLSRLLSPTETGVFAVAAVFASLASTFRDFGVAEYLIQEKELNPDKIRAAFTVNLAISWAMGLALFFGAPFAADFYRNPGVANVMHVQAFSFFFIPFGAVTMAYFQRQLDFRPIFIAGLLANLTSFVVAIGCALQGLGYMSLAWSALAGVVVTVATSVWFRPADFPRWPGIKEVGNVIHFGKFASGIYVFGQVGKGAPEMIIGRVQDMAGVALFSRAGGLIEIFQRTVIRAITPVCLPYFSKRNREQGGVIEPYLLTISYLTAIGWPILAFLGVVAYAAIRLLYGAQWMASVPLAQILCAAGAIELVHTLSKEALLASGNVKRTNILQLGIQAGRVAGLLAVVPFGLVGGCWGLLVAAVFGSAYSQWHLHHAIGLSLRGVIQSCQQSFFITVLTIIPVAIWVALEGVSETNFLRLGFGGGALTAAMWLLSMRALRHPLWHELTTLTQQILRKIRAR